MIICKAYSDTTDCITYTAPEDVQVVPELWSGEESHGRVSAVGAPLQKVPNIPPPVQTKGCKWALALAAPTRASLAEERRDASLSAATTGDAAGSVAFEILLHSLQTQPCFAC